MIRRASLVFLFSLLGFGAIGSLSAHAQMQQGYANGQPDVTVDRSVLQDLKGYQPPPMFGGDMMPPTTNRVDTSPRVEKPQKNVEVTPLSNSPATAVTPPPAATMTSPDAEALLNHPTQNFHVLTERSASMTAPSEPLDNADGPLLPLPDDVASDPAREHAKAVKAKTELQNSPVKKSSPKKEDKKKNKSTEKAKAVAEEKKASVAKKPETVVIEGAKTIPPNPDAYKPKAPQSMPAIPPVKVEKNILPPMSNSPLPNLPPTSDTTIPIEKPTPGLRMMDAALERQMESDENKIKEQLAETTIKTVKSPETTPAAKTSTAPETSGKTLIFSANETNLSRKMMAQIKNLILPELRKELQKNTRSRIQIISFATAPDKTETSARRISLARSLAVRDYLKTLEVDVSRIDVRALVTEGNAVPADRIDLVLLK